MQPAPSFSEHPAAEPRGDRGRVARGRDNDEYELFVAERDGRVVGHTLLYRRPPDLRVPRGSIDLAQASTEPEARGTGVGRALTAHVLVLGPRARLSGDDDRLADDEPLGLALLAAARLPRRVSAALPLDPVVTQRVPLLFGTRLTVVDVPDDAVVLRPPPPGEPVADVRAAVRDALALPARRRAARGARDARRARDDRGRAAGAAAAGRAATTRGRTRSRPPRPSSSAPASRPSGRRCWSRRGLTRRPQQPRARAARRRLPRLRAALPRHGRDPRRREPGPRRAGARGTRAAAPSNRALARHRPGADRQRRRDGARRRACAAARLRGRRGAAGGDRVLAARDRRLAGLAAGDAARAPARRPRCR